MSSKASADVNRPSAIGKNAPDAPADPMHPFTLRSKFDTVDRSRSTDRETLVP